MARNGRIECRHEHVEFVVYRALGHRDIQSTCLDCKKEWTVTEPVEDLSEPVSADEIIEVHRLLNEEGLPRFDK